MSETARRRWDFRLFLTGTFLQFMGTSMVSVALAAAVLAYGATADLGIVLAANSAPMILVLLVGGVVADRVNRVRLIASANAGVGAATAGMAWLIVADLYNVAWVALLAAASGGCAALASPALRSATADLAGPTAPQRANSLRITLRNLSKTLGPTISGAVAVTAGGGYVLAATAVLCFTSAMCLLCISSSRTASSFGEEDQRPSGVSVLQDLLDGWRAFRSVRWLVVIVSVMAVAGVLYVGGWTVLSPAMVINQYSAAVWGALLGTRAVGMIGMGLFMYAVTFRRLLPFGQAAAAVSALPLIALGSNAPLGLLFLVVFLSGLAATVNSVSWETTLQEQLPRHSLARVSSIEQLVTYLGVPIGQLLALPASELIGPERTLLAAGVTMACLILIPLGMPSVWRIASSRRTPPAP